MYVTDPFRYFNPKTGEAPEFFNHMFSQIIERARALLDKRTQLQIRAAWKAIQWMSEDERIESQKWERLLREAESPAGQPIAYDPTSDSDTGRLMACREIIDVSDYKKFPNGSWPEYFAVLALAHTGLACDDEHRRKPRRRVEDADRYENHMRDIDGHWAIHAMEAITTAEWIKREELLLHSQSSLVLDEHKKRISLQARSAAIARHSKTDALKREFIKYRLSNSDLSAAAAARQFLESLVGERRRILAPTNAMRTLSNAWTAHLKEQSRSAG
jgi:hypothetical protein